MSASLSLCAISLACKLLDHLLDVAFDEPVETVKRQTDAVVGHAILREIIGADLFFPSASADEALAMRQSTSPPLRAACLRGAARA